MAEVEEGVEAGIGLRSPPAMESTFLRMLPSSFLASQLRGLLLVPVQMGLLGEAGALLEPGVRPMPLRAEDVAAEEEAEEGAGAAVEVELAPALWKRGPLLRTRLSR